MLFDSEEHIPGEGKRSAQASVSRKSGPLAKRAGTMFPFDGFTVASRILHGKSPCFS